VVGFEEDENPGTRISAKRSSAAEVDVEGKKKVWVGKLGSEGEEGVMS